MENNLEKAFENHKKVVANTDDKRAQLIDKVFSAAMKLDITGDIPASLLESRMGVINAADSIMKSREAAATNSVKLAISDKTADAVEDQAQLVAGLLSRINLADKMPDQVAGHSCDLGEVICNDDFEKSITPGEVELGGKELEKFNVKEEDK